ncbi:MAG TPA: hypothetical protein PK153_19545, partial [Leptospiraceae bacterium]|nr:hypothetical protein [Leptospiraceae bacterium]
RALRGFKKANSKRYSTTKDTKNHEVRWEVKRKTLHALRALRGSKKADSKRYSTTKHTKEHEVGWEVKTKPFVLFVPFVV